MYKNRFRGSTTQRAERRVSVFGYSSEASAGGAKARRAFTLIELLVVIAIIGILSAVVLASLNTARSKGNDAAIQSDLSTIQTEAEIYYGGLGNNSYGISASTCTTAGSMFVVDTVIANAISGADSANGAAAAMVCNSTATAYAVSSPLTSTTGYWCVDSTGVAGKRATALGTATACPAT